MRPSAFIPKTLAALTLGALLGVTACSGQSDSQQDANSASPSAEAAATQSEVATPTPTPTPTETHHPNWVESVVGTQPMPAKWQGGAGWKLDSPVGTKVSAIYGLKKSMAVITHGEGIPGVLTTYDNNGNVIDKSPEITQFATSAMKAPHPYMVWSKGKSYLMMMQGGSLVPEPGSTKKAGWGVIFSSFDTSTGKMTGHGTIPVDEGSLDVRQHGGSIHLHAHKNGKVTRTFIDPETGKTDLNHDPLWAARVDGIDVTEDFESVPLVTSKDWTIENATVSIGAKTISDTNLLAIEQHSDSSYKAIDVHTGKEPAWTAKIADPKSYLVDLAGFHAGVYAFQNAETRAYTFINPKTGKLVKLTDDDTFKPEIIAMDGVVYGQSAAVKGEEVPAYLDLNEGEPKTLGVKGTLTPLEVTEDGLALFGSGENGYWLVNPVAAK